MKSILISVMLLLTVGSAHADWRGHPGMGHPGGFGGGYGGQYHGWHPGGGPDVGSSIIGGAIGSFLWNQFAQPAPVIVQQPPIIVQQPVVPEIQPGTPAWNAYCAGKYRTYNPETGTYVGFDGQPHACQ